MSRQKTSRRERFYSVIISALCLCAVVLVVAIVVDYKFSPAEDVQAKATAKPIVSATVEPLTLRVELPPTQAPEGKAGVTPEPTEEPAPAAYPGARGESRRHARAHRGARADL